MEQSPEAIIYAMDEASIKREATISHGWYPKGKTSVVMSPATKEKVSIVGAVKIGSGNLVHQKVEYFRKEQVIDFLELLREEEKDSEGPIYIILDNARPHKAIAVKEYPKTVGVRFRMLWLPPYSPELNPSENIRVHRGQVYFIDIWTYGSWSYIFLNVTLPYRCALR